MNKVKYTEILTRIEWKILLMARRTKSKKSTEKILFLHQNNYLEGSHVFEYILLKKNLNSHD